MPEKSEKKVHAILTVPSAFHKITYYKYQNYIKKREGRKPVV